MFFYSKTFTFLCLTSASPNTKAAKHFKVKFSYAFHTTSILMIFKGAFSSIVLLAIQKVVELGDDKLYFRLVLYIMSGATTC